jgi:voltage-gated potassium channel
MNEKPVRNVIPFEVFMTGLSIYGMTVVSLRLFLDTGSEMQRLFLYFDWMVCIIFLIAFIRHAVFETHRFKYIFTWGILDLISSVPWFPVLRYIRVFRLSRIGWLVRKKGALGIAIQRDPSSSLLYLLTLVMILVYSGSCVGILAFESNDVNAKIRTGGDALWFGLVTVSTVGYGDKVPVTIGARICAAVLMFTGIGIFASLAGFMLEPLRRLANGKRNVTTADVEKRLNDLYKLLEQNAQAQKDAKAMVVEEEKEKEEEEEKEKKT